MLRIITLVLICAAVFFSGSLVAAERVALPGDMLIDIGTGKLDHSIQNLEAFVIKAIEGTPAAMRFQPGLISMLMPMALRLPSSAIDMEKPMRLVICNPKDGGEPPAALILPIKGDLKTALAAAEQLGMTVTEADGVFKVTSPITPSPMHMIDPGGNRAVASENPEHARHVAGIIKGWNPPPSAKPTFTITFEVAKAVMLNGGKIDAALAGIDAMLKNADNAGDQPDAIPNPEMVWARIGLPYLKQLRLIGESVEVLTKEIYASPESLRVHTTIVPKANTSLEKVAKDFAGTTPVYEMLNLFPAASPLICAVNTSSAANQDLIAAAIGLVGEMEKNLVPGGTSELSACIKESVALIGEDVTFGILPADKTGTPRYATYLRVKDGKAYIEMIHKATAASLTFVDAIYKSIGIGMKLTGNIDKDAGAIDGIKYSTITFDIKSADGGKQMPPQALAMMKEMAKMQTQTITSIDNTVFVAQGNSSVDTLKVAIKALSEYDPKAAPARTIPAKTQIFFSQIRLLDALKIIMTQQLKMMPIPGMQEHLPTILAGIPDSTVPVQLLGGAEENTLVFDADIPTAAISELASNLFKAFMKVQKAETEKRRARMKREEEPPVPEEEAPVEAF